ncbi:MAG: HalD/BesD family halogenase [Acidimicrobiia bacterium]
MRPDPVAVIDHARYPVDDLADPRTIALARGCRADLDARGVAIVPGFVTADAVQEMAEESARLAAGAHHQDIGGTPYLELPADHWPDGHPRLTTGRSALTAVPYDDFGPESALRALYEWDPLMAFVALALGRDVLYRYDDDLGALNVAAMSDGDELFWHFDQTDFVVSIALQPSTRGGDFECVPTARTADDERYDDVGRILAGDAPERVTTVPMAPGTLMFFEGRHSLHRVTPIGGGTPRLVALLAYDTRPGTRSSELLRLVRYGRSERKTS